jgi:hypothetical protein
MASLELILTSALSPSLGLNFMVKFYNPTHAYPCTSYLCYVIQLNFNLSLSLSLFLSVSLPFGLPVTISVPAGSPGLLLSGTPLCCQEIHYPPPSTFPFKTPASETSSIISFTS